MPIDAYSESLSESLSRVLEDAAFVFAEEPDGPLGDWEDEVIEVQLAFSGDRSGNLTMYLERAFAERLAEELMVEGPEDSLGIEVGAELLNIIAGMWAPAAFGPRVLVKLDSPVANCIPAEQAPANGHGAELVTDEGERIALRVAA